MNEGLREMMETVFKRIEFLDALAENPSEKRELVSQLDVSRSTVNRGVQDLEQFGLVAYENSAYELTVCGRLLYEQYSRYEESAEAIVAADELLQHLPKETPISLDFIWDAEVFVAEEPAPAVPVSVLTEIIRDADRIRGLSQAHAAPKAEDALRMAIDGGATAEIVFCKAVYEHVQATYDWIADRIAAGDYQPYVTGDLPFGLIIADHDETTYCCVVVYTDQSSIAGLMVNDTRAAVTWASKLFESHRQQADPVVEAEIE
ncbi:helix-turn-helix transcriptional regulator [Halostella pelagica]|uniref:helix-turn-helix transcriptional regulator n=1 Tax=Halostella pelagica TaxID=2583824 RepID=UPI001080AD2B|nr:helix-turn-helix domain-containing protein [Halostella pelagica]